MDIWKQKHKPTNETAGGKNNTMWLFDQTRMNGCHLVSVVDAHVFFLT